MKVQQHHVRRKRRHRSLRIAPVVPATQSMTCTFHQPLDHLPVGFHILEQQAMQGSYRRRMCLEHRLKRR